MPKDFVLKNTFPHGVVQPYVVKHIERLMNKSLKNTSLSCLVWLSLCVKVVFQSLVDSRLESSVCNRSGFKTIRMGSI